jgi:hypothetical protein
MSDNEGGHNDYILQDEDYTYRPKKTKIKKDTLKKLKNYINNFYFDYKKIINTIFYIMFIILLFSIGGALIGFVIDGGINIWDLPSSYQMNSSYDPIPRPDAYSIKKFVTIILQVFTFLSGLAIIITGIVLPIKKYKIEI